MKEVSDERKRKVDLFSKVDFGDIDANADPNLDKYFIDNGYWNSIIDSPIYYVIGKKERVNQHYIKC